ncbi:DUF1244 domain-containing protein [Novosphingobium sp. Chol11]|uniref:DUF1244 domain-containing protein n=1 Tax=Novosphingobium sp. Chol11 TaxID=1385763 RepID=UPI0025E4EC9C|nr:DUF1244 domain-containing protein [Novosphingobium sp. Chol11]
MDTNSTSAADSPPQTGLDDLPDAVAAAAFRRLVHHLRRRHDAQNIELMGLAGFCRNCLADWIIEAGAGLDKAAAREMIHGMPAAEWKARFQSETTPEQIARMDASMARNAQ